ncbi:MAG: VWA domain-containing protein [Candidatus Heimdallarchaeota archaeon]|nr:VWA domain-containing protein [Candidatus Heimdallarchaeota archaeon]MCG3254762.1 VWA domain-containing protein [Candidatus Heimdallarchaeota archaeon]MCK4609841.1 VWA domain-containing protein [Candidatus Heimdallarchaeota archaeon]
MTINEIHLELGKKEDNMARIIELAERAAKESNLEGLRLIATNYPMIAAKILNKIELTDQMLDNLTGEDLIQLYSRTKKHLNYNIRKKLLEKLIPFITEKAKTIFRRGISSSVSRYVNYQPGDSWEIEMTFEKMLSSGKQVPDYDCIVVKEPSKRKKSIVICIDKSLSVLQLIHQIVLMASVLSLSVKRDNFAIIEFDSEAQLLKPMSKRIPPEELVELILNIESGGKTDLDKALQLATKQLKDSSSREKIIYIISDLERTIGKNPLPIIQRIPDLRIVYARTYRRVSFVDEIVSLPNVKMVELNHNSDLVELTTKLVS